MCTLQQRSWRWRELSRYGSQLFQKSILLSQADSIMLFGVNETKKMIILWNKCSADKLLHVIISTVSIWVTAVCMASTCVYLCAKCSLNYFFYFAPLQAKWIWVTAGYSPSVVDVVVCSVALGGIVKPVNLWQRYVKKRIIHRLLHISLVALDFRNTYSCHKWGYLWGGNWYSVFTWLQISSFQWVFDRKAWGQCVCE